ncbi:putative D-amino-acid oxidase [Actinoplanes missouriensis 431]|uniref:D-amino-acid oxidase n=1 Tax=Actinoplanes missouriensis (strain ATCC 14538 / DSM 43046 / CBS 188.64 / JCM 3121 / NBRC 102363 / NCIMB 12654 / NRRL B-3342 / UNCC 431) TaxID=512565 RepID=I0H871_ACTM4|nr:putative D-amino-acid oxidase [Actinoplanes missouriensis 431]
MPVSSVTVVGAGVVGMSIAHELATAGHRVRILASEPATAGVSAVAAAIWFPHDVRRSPAVLESASVAYQRFQRLAAVPETGVHMRTGTVITRRPDADLSWTSAVPGHTIRPDGVRCVVPLIQTDVYLTWLRTAIHDLGVRVRTATVRSVPDDEVVVVAAGIRSAELLGDTGVFPIRGQVVRLANPGLTDWITDEDNPDGLTYVVPRRDDVVCGGTGEHGDWSTRPDPATEEAILRRARALVPELTGQPILSRAAGLRPGRSSVRVEPVPGHGRPVFACYGHGGAGFTLSWGDAARIAAMIGAEQ